LYPALRDIFSATMRPDVRRFSRIGSAQEKTS
jgi:hypothetical protein